MSSPITYPIDAHHLLRKKRAIRRELLAHGELVDKRIAILGGSTTAEVKDMLELFLLEAGIRPEFYESEFNRYTEDILFPESGLQQFRPEFIYLHTSNLNLSGYPSPGDDEREVDALLASELARFEALWQRIDEDHGCPVIQNNFELPLYRGLGNLDASAVAGHTRFTAELNARFAAAARQRPNLQLNDIHYLSARLGLDSWYDLQAKHAYKYAMGLAALPHVAHSVASIVKALLGKSKKCLVLDLDNTLWGGVIGDDGLAGIQIGKETALAEAHTEFQTYVKALKQQGVILAVCSKNDEAVAKEAFTHPDSVLKLDDFSEFIANWQPKSDNITEIARRLNIGIDSLVFADDNPAERSIVRSQAPRVTVPELGSDVSQYLKILDRSGLFESTGVSREDAQRSAMYADNRARDSQQQKFANYGEFLASLQMQAEILPVPPVYLDRVTQLTNKTNQFNLTTRRYTLAELTEAARDPGQVLLYGRLVDSFGDNGIVSVVLGRRVEQSLFVDLWLMSCRVLKRGMEAAMLDALVVQARAQGLSAIVGHYLASAKNSMVARMYADFGFEPAEPQPGAGESWRLDISGAYLPRNLHIEVNK